MDVWFCRGRNHSREALMRAGDLDRKVRALTSAPGHVCFSLTGDLHGCRSADHLPQGLSSKRPVCQQCAGPGSLVKKMIFYSRERAECIQGRITEKLGILV